MYLLINKCVTAVKVSNFSGHYLRNRSTLDKGVWVISVYSNIRNILPNSGIFLLGHPVYWSFLYRSIQYRCARMSSEILRSDLCGQFVLPILKPFKNLLLVSGTVEHVATRRVLSLPNLRVFNHNLSAAREWWLGIFVVARNVWIRSHVHWWLSFQWWQWNYEA